VLKLHGWLLPIAALTVLSACGSRGQAATSPKGPVTTVNVEMRDIAFDPPTLAVSSGQTVRLVFTNKGKLTHDAFIGDEQAQAEHEKTARSMGQMDHGSKSNAISVSAGTTRELVYTFDKAGTVFVGCHEPGHYASGMKVQITIA